MQPVITVWRASDVPRLWEDQIGSWFEREFNWPIARTARPDWRVLVTAGEDLIGHAAIVLRRATVGASPVRIGGIGAVIIQPQWRGQGLGKRTMQEVAAFLRDSTNAAFGHLICEEHRRTFYEGLGWQKVAGPMVFTDWQGKRDNQGQHHIMVLPLRNTPSWPGGELDLCGLPW
jgi:GNAT superfamily N-acetyltransferase